MASLAVSVVASMVVDDMLKDDGGAEAAALMYGTGEGKRKRKRKRRTTRKNKKIKTINRKRNNTFLK